MIDYYLKSAPAGEVTLEILDAKGEVVRSYSSKPQPAAPRRVRGRSPMSGLTPPRT